MTKNTTHKNRFSELNKEKDQFINARITTPQTYEEITKKGQATILKIASKGIVEKLLKRCEYYKAIITRKTETIKSKNELITLLAQKLSEQEPDLFQADFKQHAEAVEQAKSEEVKTELENEAKEELNKEEKEKVKTDNEKHEKDTDPDNLEDDPEETDDIDDGPEEGPECGEGGDGPDLDDDPDREDPEDITEDKDEK